MEQDKRETFGEGYFEKGLMRTDKEAYRGYTWGQTSPYFGIMARTLRSVFHPRKVLDIGCAKGYLVFLLQGLGIDAYGVDVSEYALSCAPPLIKEKLQLLDIEQEAFPFSPAQFEVATILEIVEHLNTFDHLLEELRRVVRQGGYVLVTSPVPQSKAARGDRTHINVHPQAFWSALFKRHGFSCVQDTLWKNFKRQFLGEFAKVADYPPATKAGEILLRSGPLGRMLRNHLFPYVSYFSLWRETQIMLFCNNAQYK